MGATFHVAVSDNFHFMNQSHDYQRPGTYTTIDAAIEAAKRIVDEDLEAVDGSGKTAADLYRSWAQFGDSPFIKSSDGSPVAFSASEYARELAVVMTQ